MLKVYFLLPNLISFSIFQFQIGFTIVLFLPTILKFQKKMKFIFVDYFNKSFYLIFLKSKSFQNWLNFLLASNDIIQSQTNIQAIKRIGQNKLYFRHTAL